MTGSCPKCGSNQILNDECLGCGLLISRYNPDQAKSASLSYVSPDGPTPTGIVLVPPRKNIRSKILSSIVLLLLFTAGYQIYQYFLRQAAAYGGYYRNMSMVFTLNFPEKGWYHYYDSDLKQAEFRDAGDAFYRGGSARDPDLVMVVWTEDAGTEIPGRFDDETARIMLESLEREVVTRMEKANLDCTITESKRILIGGNEGFLLLADVQKEAERMKTAIYCAFNNRMAYTIQFLGKEKAFLDSQQEIETMMSSFNFRLSLF